MKSSPPLVYSCRVAPRFEDTDAYGILHHSRYLVYVEEAKLAFMSDPAAFGTDVMAEADRFVVTELKVKYIRATAYRPGILLDVQLAFSIEAEVRVRFDFVIREGESVICRGFAVHAAMDEAGHLRMSLPEAWRLRYEELLRREAALGTADAAVSETCCRLEETAE